MHKISTITMEPNVDGSKDITILTETGVVCFMANIVKITGDIRWLLRWPVTSAVMTTKVGAQVFQLFTERACISFEQGG